MLYYCNSIPYGPPSVHITKLEPLRTLEQAVPDPYPETRGGGGGGGGGEGQVIQTLR